MRGAAYGKAFGWCVLGAALGVLVTLASWIGRDEPFTNWFGTWQAMALVFLLIGVVLQRWTTAAEVALVAAALVAGAVVTSGLADRDDGGESWGRSPPVGAFALVLVAAWVVLALLGHAAAAALRRPRPGDPPTPP